MRKVIQESLCRERAPLAFGQFYGFGMGTGCVKSLWSSVQGRGNPPSTIHNAARPEQIVCAKTAVFTRSANNNSQRLPQPKTAKPICYASLFPTIHTAYKYNNYSY